MGEGNPQIDREVHSSVIRRIWHGWIVGLLCSAALTLNAPLALAVNGGEGETDVCRQGSQSVVCGNGATAEGARSTVIGFNAQGDGISDVVIGSHARTAQNNPPSRENVAIGGVVEIGGGAGIATVADGGGSTAVGAGARAGAERSVALGRYSISTGANSVVLGAGSSDGGLSDVVSFGNTDLKRSLININNITNTGTTSSNQLIISEDATIGNGLKVESGGANIFGGINANNAKVTEIADGEVSAESTDAVNGRQLHTTNQNVAVAQSTADAAQSAANAAHDAANAAQETANTALAAAGNAQSTADAAQSAANAAQNTANTALTAAGNAQGTAEAAQADALSALANLQTLINQLLESGVCGLDGGSVNCGEGVQLGGGTVDAGATNAIAVGSGAHVQSSGGIAIGQDSTAVQTNSVAIGTGAMALSSVAVGTGAQATGTNSAAFGDDAVAAGDYSVAIGNQAEATHENSVAIGNGSTTSGDNTVSVGSEGNERRITNVAPGVAGTDAVNMDQLHAVAATSGGASLSAAKAYTDERVAELRNHTSSGIAATAAIVNVRPSTVGKTALGIGVGHYDGLTAVGFSLTHAPQENMLFSFGAAATIGGLPVVQGGFSVEF